MRSLVVLVALLARLAPLALLPPYPLQDDTRMYVGIATNVLDGWGFSYDFNGDGVPEVTNEEPGYPLVLAGLVAIAGDHALTLARWIQIVFGAVAAVLVFDLGVRLGSRRGGLVAGMAYALHPGLVLEAGVPGHEAALVPLVVLAVWLTTRYITAGSLLVAFAAGLVWGAATLVKQTVLALPLISAGVLVAAAKGNRRWMGPVAIAVAFLCAVAPWTIRALMVRFMAARMVAEVAPGVDRAAPQELRRLGRQLQEQKLRERIHPKTPETTTLARVAYEFTADPRRPLAVIVAGGGEVEALLLRPWDWFAGSWRTRGTLECSAGSFSRPTRTASSSSWPRARCSSACGFTAGNPWTPLSGSRQSWPLSWPSCTPLSWSPPSFSSVIRSAGLCSGPSRTSTSCPS